jgi:hypothetical protein
LWPGLAAAVSGFLAAFVTWNLLSPSSVLTIREPTSVIATMSASQIAEVTSLRAPESLAIEDPSSGSALANALGIPGTNFALTTWPVRSGGHGALALVGDGGAELGLVSSVTQVSGSPFFLLSFEGALQGAPLALHPIDPAQDLGRAVLAIGYSRDSGGQASVDLAHVTQVRHNVAAVNPADGAPAQLPLAIQVDLTMDPTAVGTPLFAQDGSLVGLLIGRPVQAGAHENAGQGVAFAVQPPKELLSFPSP